MTDTARAIVFYRWALLFPLCLPLILAVVLAFRGELRYLVFWLFYFCVYGGLAHIVTAVVLLRTVFRRGERAALLAIVFFPFFAATANILFSSLAFVFGPSDVHRVLFQKGLLSAMFNYAGISLLIGYWYLAEVTILFAICSLVFTLARWVRTWWIRNS